MILNMEKIQEIKNKKFLPLGTWVNTVGCNAASLGIVWYEGEEWCPKKYTKKRSRPKFNLLQFLSGYGDRPSPFFRSLSRGLQSALLQKYYKNPSVSFPKARGTRGGGGHSLSPKSLRMIHETWLATTV